jgi:hypothetical protein
MCRDYVEEKRQLIKEILRDRKLSKLPKIQQVLIILANYYWSSDLNDNEVADE